jgi:DNA repair photolyase
MTTLDRGMASLYEPICHLMWSVTPYKLCDYRCVYCCTGVQGQSDPLMTPEEAVAETRRVVPTFGDNQEEKALRLMILGAFADAYPSVELEHGITRAILTELVAMGERVNIVTKGTSVLRDIDLFLAAGDRCTVQISVCSTDDDALVRIDGHSPPGSERLRVIDELYRAGVHVEVNALPWIPGVTHTGELIARIPTDVPITFSPLSFGEGRDSRHMLGRLFTRDQVWQAYGEAYEEYGHIANTSWVKPTLPPEENHPILRLPRLAPRAAVAAH